MTTINLTGMEPGNSARIHISTLRYDGKATFDFDGRYGGYRDFSGCTNITREDAEAIVATLLDRFPPVPKPEPVPDIVLPNTGSPQDAPLTAVVTVNGQLLHLVNWHDYRGWEVRKGAAGSNGLNFGSLDGRDRLGHYGFISCEPPTAYTASRKREFKRIDEALLWLISLPRS